MKNLKIHENKRYLMWEDGTPFYYLADTAWELAHKLNKRQIEQYLTVRAKQGFHVIQVAALAELDGIRKPNALGHYPFPVRNGNYQVDFSVDCIETDYWNDLDEFIQTAGDKNLIVGLLPTWGDKFNQLHGKGPEIFNPKNAYSYGKWLGERYKNNWNLIWILGGDRPLQTDFHRDIIDSMAAGIKTGDEGSHLMTFHPCGGASSLDFVPQKDYIDFHAIQSGHGMECYESWKILRKTRVKEEKPFLDMESRYEHFPACFHSDYGYEWDSADLRQNNYWNMMEGACGQTYGHRAIWCFNERISDENPYLWQEVLQDSGALEMKYLEKLRLSRPFFEFRNAEELIIGQIEGSGYQCAGRGENYAYLYSPLGLPIYTDLTSFGGDCIKASWFNPRTGEENVFAAVTAIEKVFVPPSAGKGNDWVLILDKLQ